MDVSVGGARRQVAGPGRPSRSWIARVALAAGLVVGAAACGGDDAPEASVAERSDLQTGVTTAVSVPPPVPDTAPVTEVPVAESSVPETEPVVAAPAGETPVDEQPEPEPTPAAAPTSFSHTFPAEYEGPVWVTITAPDAQPRSVVLRWGPWQKPFTHQGVGPATYAFGKGATKPGEQTVPTTVDIEPGATVEFGQGAPPPGTVSVANDWIPATP